MFWASGAPIAALDPRDALHVLDRFSIELVIKRREVMHRALPLLVDVLVAFTALLRIHEEIGRDDAAGVRTRGRGPERRVRAAALFGHGGGDDARITDAIGWMVKASYHNADKHEGDACNG